MTWIEKLRNELVAGEFFGHHDNYDGGQQLLISSSTKDDKEGVWAMEWMVFSAVNKDQRRYDQYKASFNALCDERGKNKHDR